MNAVEARGVVSQTVSRRMETTQLNPTIQSVQNSQECNDKAIDGNAAAMEEEEFRQPRL